MDEVRDLRRRLEAIEADKSKDVLALRGFKPFAAWIRDSPPNSASCIQLSDDTKEKPTPETT